jgi:hypothetical protein
MEDDFIKVQNLLEKLISVKIELTKIAALFLQQGLLEPSYFLSGQEHNKSIFSL